MDSSTTPSEGSSTQEDFVLIDRATLRQTLEAVLNTLRSSINFELLQKNQVIDPDQHAELHQQMVNARGALITGIKKMLKTVESLPAVEIKKEDS